MDFTQGAKVAGLSACPNFVTNGEQAHYPFPKNVPNWLRTSVLHFAIPKMYFMHLVPISTLEYLIIIANI